MTYSMTSTRYSCAAFLFCILVPFAFAQTNADTEKILIPLTPERIAGAFGSEWRTDIAVTNLSDTPVGVYGYTGECSVEPCSAPPPIPPHATVFIYSMLRPPVGQGGYLFVDRGRSRDVAITLRSRDVSRGHETWGTVVPVARATDLREGRFGFTDMPTGNNFRVTLRVYDVNAQTPARARIRVYGVDPARDSPRTTNPDPLLFEREIVFSQQPTSTHELFHPNYAEIALSSEPALAGSPRMRIEVEPLTGEREYWGFVTVTHNETQHVTVLQP